MAILTAMSVEVPLEGNMVFYVFFIINIFIHNQFKLQIQIYNLIEMKEKLVSVVTVVFNDVQNIGKIP